jgi:hypothetical protein
MKHLRYCDVVMIGKTVHEALHYAFQDRSRSEPQLVANFVWALPNFIKKNEAKFSGATKIKAGGVFIHSRPLVTYDVSFPRTVEIGDLLLIRTLVINKNIKEQRALLLQAKKAKIIPAQPDNQKQWSLYEKWPRFTYARGSGALKGKKRHINEPDMYDAAKYLLIGSHPLSCDWACIHDMDYCLFHIHKPDDSRYACWTAHPTRPQLSRYRCFACELIEFLAGNAGKVFEEPVPITRGWNRVIKDLINMTSKAKSIFMQRAAAGLKVGSSRGTALFCTTTTKQSNFFLVAGDCEWIKEPQDVPSEWSKDDGSGISIIEVIIEQKRERD